MIKKDLAAGIIGNALEWYDFFLYAYLASILAPLFFPSQNPSSSLLIYFGIFAVSFLARPLGGLMMGRLGDIYGRKKILIFSLSLMTLPTLAIGLLPTYNSLGIISPVLLTLLRFLQSLAISGEVTTSASFLIEHATHGKRGFISSFVLSTSFFGALMGVITMAFITSFIPSDILKTWGWRIPFLLSGPLGILAFILRFRAIESPYFAHIKTKVKTPLSMIISQYYSLIAYGTGAAAMGAIAVYFLVGYFTNFLVQPVGLPLKQAVEINAISLFAFVLLIPYGGFLSDFFGRKKVFIGGIILMTLLSLPVFWLISHKTFFYAMLGELLFIIPLSATQGTILCMLAEQFPTQIRTTSFAISYNTTQLIFGGVAPFIAIALVDATKQDLAPVIYLLAGALISFSCVLMLKETSEQELL